MTRHTVSAVVPAFNATNTLPNCLAAIGRLVPAVDEIIVYVDGSTDTTEAIARAVGARVIVNAGPPKGPGRGRNEAVAIATGDFVLFVDADVIIAPDALTRMLAEVDAHGAVAAFGSYDTAPRSTRVASFYANLRHHHIHQNSARDASTFWTGTGVIRRDIFLRFGGFDTVKYPYPSIEDVELGMRITAGGHRIRLVPEALSKHCKDWTVLNVWHTDIVRRAYPWSCLLIDGSAQALDLNLDRTERTKAMLAVGAAGSLITSPLLPVALPFAAALLGLYVWLNRAFFGLLLSILGGPRAFGAMAMHFAYHLYSTATYAYTLIQMRFGSRRAEGKTRTAARP